MPRVGLVVSLVMLTGGVPLGCGGSTASDGGSESSSTTGVADTTTSPPTTTAPSESSGSTSIADSSTSIADSSTTIVGTDSSSSTGTTGEPSSSSSSSGESSDGSSSSTGDPIDCDALPVGPLPYTVKELGGAANEDFAWDDQGNMVGHNGSAVFRTQYDGDPQLWIPGINSFIAGFRATSDGVFVFNDVSLSTLFRINAQGAIEVVLGGWNYPNGMDVGLDGFAYVAEESASRVRRVNVETGEFTVLANGLVEPNGVSFSPDYSTLYVGSFGGGTITAIHLAPDGTPTGVEPFYEGVGGGALDGMAVDACGNVYVCEFGPAIVWRIAADGGSIEELVDLGQETSWIPNLQFGSGYGGWDRHTLYVLEIGGERVFEVDVGVTDKPRSYP